MILVRCHRPDNFMEKLIKRMDVYYSSKMSPPITKIYLLNLQG